MSELKKQLADIYYQFMTDMQIDRESGIVNREIPLDTNGEKWRFGTMPYIGKKYDSANRKILFIGLDLGEDINGHKNTYLDFDFRHDSIVRSDFDFNPHIAGTYAISLAILSQYNTEWQYAWNALSSDKEALNRCAVYDNRKILPIDALECVGLTNLFKFVTVGRDRLAGNSNRHWIDKNIELNLLKSEIDAYSPDIIILQGSGQHLPQEIFDYCWGKKIVVLNGCHPSAWRGGWNKISGIEKLLKKYKKLVSPKE